MASTKVSGLTATAGFTLATTQEFGINEGGVSKKISATQIAAFFPLGRVGYAAVTATQGPFTTQIDVTSLTVTVTPMAAGRRFRLSCGVPFSSSVASDVIRIYLMEGATQLAQTDWMVGAATGAIPTLSLTAILTPTNAAHTYKVQAQRASGSGTTTMQATVTNPAWILCEDIGT